MSRITFTVLCCLLVASLLRADTISPTNGNIRYVGRFDHSTPTAPRMYWSGTHLKAWFEGTSIQVKLNCAGSNDFFNIIVDDGTPMKYGLVPGPQTLPVTNGLADKVHKIEVFKRTSYQQDNTAFEGFVTDSGKGLIAPPPAKAIRIQFYGDSITDGHSVDFPPGADDASATYWNNSLTYAARTARTLDMEYWCVAASGIAVIHDWGGDFNMSNYYDRVNPGDMTPSGEWDFTGDDPDIVVINLFQNDKWVSWGPHSGAQQNEIISAYESLLLRIRGVHTNAEIICTAGDMDVTDTSSGWYTQYINSAVSRMNGTHGDSKVYSHFFTYRPQPGHPKAVDQAVMATSLTSYIESNFSYLFTRDTDGDGMSDVDEARFGTDWSDKDSFFEVQSVNATNSSIELTWPSRTGIQYELLESTNLSTWTTNAGSINPLTPPVERMELTPTAQRAYFRLKAVAP